MLTNQDPPAHPKARTAGASQWRHGILGDLPRIPFYPAPQKAREAQKSRQKRGIPAQTPIKGGSVVYQRELPLNARPIKIQGQFRTTHYLDDKDQLWWYCNKACRIYGTKYYKGYYLKEPIYSIGSQKYSLGELKLLAGSPI
jgi:hypothetical protein